MPCVQLLLSHSTSPQGPDLVGVAHMESPTINDIHDHPEAKHIGVKVEIGLIFM